MYFLVLMVFMLLSQLALARGCGQPHPFNEPSGLDPHLSPGPEPGGLCGCLVVGICGHKYNQLLTGSHQSSDHCHLDDMSVKGDAECVDWGQG